MKKVIIIILLLAVIGVVVWFFMSGNTFDTVKSWFGGDTQTTASAETTAAPVTETTASAAEEKIAESGGNPEEETALAIEITINNSEYLYENHAKTLDEIKDIVSSAEGVNAVVIYDENASQSAYKALSDFLAEKGIECVTASASE